MAGSAQHWTESSPSTILLIDDDPFQASARKSMLERRFSKVARASSAADALILLQQPNFARHIKLIVVDLHMPGVRGPEFVAELRARMAGMALLIVGQDGEVSTDYDGLGAYFLPWRASTEQMLASAVRILSGPYSRVA